MDDILMGFLGCCVCVVVILKVTVSRFWDRAVIRLRVRNLLMLLLAFCNSPESRKRLTVVAAIVFAAAAFLYEQ